MIYIKYDRDVLACIEQGTCTDVISLLAQLGRFDIVSFLFALVAIILALGGVIAYRDFGRVARRQAREVANRIASETAEKMVSEYLQREMPKFLRERSKRIGSTGQLGDNIASLTEAQEDEVTK